MTKKKKLKKIRQKQKKIKQKIKKNNIYRINRTILLIVRSCAVMRKKIR